MRTPISFAIFSAALFAAAPAHAQQPLPAPVRAMIDAAIAQGDEAEVAAVTKYAQRVHPESELEIKAIVDGWRAQMAELTRAEAEAVAQIQADTAKTVDEAAKVVEQAAAVEPLKIPSIWKAKVEVGGFNATGNSDYIGVTAGLNVRNEGENWRHIFIAQGDYQENAGNTTRERFLVSYQPNYRINTNAYVYSLGQYERDRFQGYDGRYSISAGLGYRMKAKNTTLDIDVGPAYRLTDYSARDQERTIAGRGSLTLDWKISPTLSFNQAAAVYVDSINSTVTGTSALAAKVYGPLSMRLSYNVQYEASPPPGKQTTDTLSRASIVYEF